LNFFGAEHGSSLGGGPFPTCYYRIAVIHAKR
jgi:hypothetical protein